MSCSHLTQAEIERHTAAAQRDGFCILREHFPKERLINWRNFFLPLLQTHIQNQGQLKNRGPARYYVTLPFDNIFCDEAIFADPVILAIVENLVGQDFVMCQLASDTPLRGSQYQEIHRDTPPLFPEIKQETPAFQLAVNFPLIDVTRENGAIEIARGTHLLKKEDGLKLIEQGEIELESYPMNMGDVMIRDVRGLHRGTPNLTNEPRPMIVIGYSRRWYFRPEVSITIPRPVWERLTPESKKMLRFNRVVDSLEDGPEPEIYQDFAY